ncbi:YtxH domain-containing protein [Bacillus spongiae]|uniref:YtxH domain-containing protein n=1 Tax=Bacillus spongiae TaxID=2683610 RepID=A0ABU8HHH8_9BACI
MSVENQNQLPNPEGEIIQSKDQSVATSENAKAKDFFIGALVGTIVGASTALFLAPKAGKELRNDVNTQASNLKAKTTVLKDSAVEKGNDLAAAAKERTAIIKKTVQESNLVEKVKKMRNMKEDSIPEESKINAEDNTPVGEENRLIDNSSSPNLTEEVNTESMVDSTETEKNIVI